MSNDLQYVRIHGHQRAFVRRGSGPALLLLHGLGCDHTTWEPVIDGLARRYTVIAPDLLGHGASDKPRADYSIGGYANGMRDLLGVLGVPRATVVGHSLGGGVAMQFAYQFPELTQRLVLVAPGGFGPEVTPAIRLVTTPGFHQAMGVLTLPGLRHLGSAGMRALSRAPGATSWDLDEVANVYESFRDEHQRAAIRHVVRAVVDWKGQVITIADRAYLTADMPVCIIWGEQDRVIPVRHVRTAREVAPSARIEVLPDSGHFPHKSHPDRFVKVVHDFVRESQPARHSKALWRRHLRSGGRSDLRGAEAGHAPITPIEIPSA